MSDDEKLASPSFEEMDAGAIFGSDAIVIDEGASLFAPLEYETIVIDEEGSRDQRGRGPLPAGSASAVRAGTLQRSGHGADPQYRRREIPQYRCRGGRDDAHRAVRDRVRHGRASCRRRRNPRPSRRRRRR